MIACASAAIVLIAALAALAVYRHQCLLRNRAELMRDAIRHRDFAFHLPLKGLLFGERALQETLNNMGWEIQKLVAQNEVESWQRLIRVLTHEIMNATTPIQGISQAYLAKPGIKGTPYEEGIRTIRDVSTGLAAFVESYRKLTLLQEPVLKDFSLQAFCNSISAIYPDISWDIQVPGDIVIHADENLLRQVFINIVKNAIEAEADAVCIRHIPHPQAQGRHQQARTPQAQSRPPQAQGSHPQPQSSHPQAFYKLQVSNNGHVISDDVAAEVFIPFFTTKPHGSGIGLSLSRQLLVMQRFSLSLLERPANGYNVTFVIEKS